MEKFLKEFITAAEQADLFWIFLFIVAITEIVKRSHRKFFKRYESPDIWFYSFWIGIIGAYLIWDRENHIPWFVIAVISGPLSNMTHRVLIIFLRKKFPDFACVLTGNKRNGISNDNGKKRRKHDK